MKTTITSKFQTTVPKVIREKLKLSVNDTLEWRVEGGKAVVIPVGKPFFKYINAIKVGAGDIQYDIETAHKIKTEAFR